MSDDTIASAHRRLAEQLMSDERVLGALPEEAANVLLTWALARLDAAAEEATDAAAFLAAAESIRQQVRATADEASARDDAAAALSERLGLVPATPVPAAPMPAQPEQPAAVAAEAPRAAETAATAAPAPPVPAPASAFRSLFGRLRRFFGLRGGYG